MVQKDLPIKDIPNHQNGGGIISQNEYLQLFESMINSLTNLNNSINKLNSNMQKTQELIVNSHNIILSRINTIHERTMHYMPKSSLNFSMELVEHCNLNCAGCDHFSPLAENKYADFDKTSKYFDRLAELFGEDIKYVQFAGGEPLLHPEITKFLIMARKKFPKAPIRVITNGIKLASMPDEFWEVCKEQNVTIMPTKYPISVDYDAMQNKAARYGVKYSYFNNAQFVKTLFKLPIDFEGLQNEHLNFVHCHRANNCIFLQNGRLYTCAFAAIIWRFDKYFGTKLFNEESNSIDIFKANSTEEILKFLAKPIPFCRYCKILNTVFDIPWHQSKRTIDEWT